MVIHPAPHSAQGGIHGGQLNRNQCTDEGGVMNLSGETALVARALAERVDSAEASARGVFGTGSD